MRQLLPLLFVGAIFVLPIVLIVVFISWRSKQRAKAMAEPWKQVAAELGGQFFGSDSLTSLRISIDRGAWQVSSFVSVVSVMDAASSPYWTDGGTFTSVRGALDPQKGARLHDKPNESPQLVDPSDAHLAAAAGIQLPPTSRIFLLPRELRVVMDGAVADKASITAALRFVDEVCKAASAKAG